MLLQPLAMHIPDGFLSVTVSIVFWVISIGGILAALSRVNRELGEREVPVMGVLAAAIFAGQMLNFSVTGGTSGHLLGAALAAVLLGPWAAVLVMTSVVSVQALIFQDGGLLVLGANLFNMAIIGPFVAYFVYRLIQWASRGQRWGIFAGGFLAAWASIEVSALSVALQLSLSGTSPANISFPTMGGIHALIGIGEGLITMGALSFIYAARRDLLKIGEPQKQGTRVVLLGGLLITLALAVLSPLASSQPDGLEWVAEQAGFLHTAQAPSYNLIPDYLFPGISNAATATIVAGVLGGMIVLGVALLVAYTRRRRSNETSTEVTGD
jgi:cobalt/nickel transport system permease protein